MSRADATKARILAAATAEFSAYGIAGARVDRIAATAQANKNLIYVYFTSKDKLFDAVFDAHVVQVMDEIPFTARDLPGYAGRLFDFYAEHPELLRLATWHRLERGADDSRLVAVVESYRHKLAAIVEAQQDGTLDPERSPAVLLTLVLTISSAWSQASPAVVPGEVPATACREAIVEAVARLQAPAVAVGRGTVRQSAPAPEFRSAGLSGR